MSGALSLHPETHVPGGLHSGDCLQESHAACGLPRAQQLPACHQVLGTATPELAFVPTLLGTDPAPLTLSNVPVIIHFTW